jgi:tetratricopeptide (TPR) repeat protein
VDKPVKDGKSFCGKLKMTFAVNWDVVDCEQAALIIKVRHAKSIELHSKKLGSKIADLSLDRHESEKVFGPIGDKDFEKVILKLGRIQRLLQKTLPFPLFGLPENIYKLLLKCRLRSRKEVRSTWNKIKRLLSQEKVKYHSTIVAKIVRDGHAIGYKYLDSVYGIHFPNIKAEFSESKIENPQDLLQKALKDPKQTIEFVAGDIILSPQAAIEYFKSHKIKYGNNEVINPVDFKDIMANSPEEHNTRVTFKWLPENDCIWHKTTPFVLQLEKLTWERWLIEADHLSKVQKDVKRAYIATKEAFSIEPQNPTVLIGHGWSAYLCKRVQEAIQVTKQILNDKEDYSQFLANINLGLYSLDKSLNNGSKTNSNLESAEQFYKKAISILDKLEEREKAMAIHSAIEDLIENKDSLRENANHYLTIFQKYDEM